MSRSLTIGFSPCPNDTFMFHALVAGDITLPGFEVTPWLADIEALNERALGSDPLPVTKLSAHGFAYVADRYRLLRAGAALGRGCGPLVVSRAGGGLDRLAGRRVAIPGRYTTAHLLLRLFAPRSIEVVPMRFEAIMPAVAAGQVEAGAVIHEGRFTYSSYGLVELADLGVLWEAETGLPLPLGVIAVLRAPALPTPETLEDRLRASILAARARPEASADYVREHAQEMDPEVCRRHIALYVNEYSVELGREGETAIEELIARGAGEGILPARSRASLW
jgi:1,4-dihydroxy-6-naphthoate synthase